MNKKFFKIITILGISLVFTTFIFGQNTKKVKFHLRKNIIDLAVGGSGQVLSLNYSRALFVKSKYFINASIGVGTAFYREYRGNNSKVGDGNTSYPHQITFNYGKKYTFFEFGLGGVFMQENFLINNKKTSNLSYFLAPVIGIRQYLFKRIVVKAFLTPIISFKNGFSPEEHLLSYAGASIGYSF